MHLSDRKKRDINPECFLKEKQLSENISFGQSQCSFLLNWSGHMLTFHFSPIIHVAGSSFFLLKRPRF